MKLIIDANILFAGLIKKSSTAELIISPKIELHSPEFLFTEFEKYRTYIIGKTHRTSEDFAQILTILKRNIHIIQLSLFERFYSHAKEISPDPKDTLYFALALKLECPIWSNDNRLKNQKEITILNTSELIDLLSNK